MSIGNNALNSMLGRIRKSLPRKNSPISVVYVDNDGNLILDPEKEYARGVLVAPVAVTESEWESEK